MKTKIKTQVKNCEIELEFEGETGEVKEGILKIVEFLSENFEASIPAPKMRDPLTRENVAVLRSSAQVASKRTVEQPKYLSELLSVQDVKKLKDYYDSKSPTTHLEAFAVFTLWLREHKGQKNVGIDEMWTSCKAVKHKSPRHIAQIFRDGKSKRGFFESTGEGRYSITAIGETFVEFDLPKQRKDTNGE